MLSDGSLGVRVHMYRVQRIGLRSYKRGNVHGYLEKKCLPTFCYFILELFQKNSCTVEIILYIDVNEIIRRPKGLSKTVDILIYIGHELTPTTVPLTELAQDIVSTGAQCVVISSCQP